MKLNFDSNQEYEQEAIKAIRAKQKEAKEI
jgi:hypothetical protein